MQQTLIAGDTLDFVESLSDYPASDGWVLKYRLVPRGAGSVIDLTAVAEGDDHRVTVTAAVTADWTAGVYGWSSWVELAGAVHTVASGETTVKPNPRTITAGTDTRSAIAQALDDARAAYRAFDPTKRRYRIGEREMEFNSAAELLRKIRQLEQELAAERGEPVPGMGGRFFYRAP